MSHAATTLEIVLGSLVYGGSLLLWPLRRVLHHRRKVRGKVLLIIWFIQLVSYLFVFADMWIPMRILEHGYYWLVILPFLNLAFGFASVVAWIRDEIYEKEHSRNAK